MNRKRTTNRSTRLVTILTLVTLLLEAAAPLVYADGTWTRQIPEGLSTQFSPAMASLGEGQVLLFGGNDGLINGETWVYDLSANSWTNQAPAAAPSARLLPCHGLHRRGPGAPVWRGG